MNFTNLPNPNLKIFSSILFLITVLPWECHCTCFESTEDSCCEGFKKSNVADFCVPDCQGDAAECDAFSSCWDEAAAKGEPFLMNKDYLDEYSDYIDFCHPETKEFHCSLGYYTGNESKELNVFCLDQCEISNTEKSCVLLRTSVCSGCKMDNVKNKAGWCSVKEGTCECKDGFHKGLCDKECPPDKTGPDCSRRCSDSCGNQNATCSAGQCICPYGSTLKEEVCQKCELGSYGEDCKEKCTGRCSFNAPLFGEAPYCDPIDGHCLCKPGRDPERDCEHMCAFGTFSPDGIQNCQSCGCKYGRPCDSITGKCECGNYLAGDQCEKLLLVDCPARMWGPNCDQECKCNAPFNCTRNEEDKGVVCRCNPNEVIDSDCKPRRTTIKPILISTPESNLSKDHHTSSHWEWIVMAIVLAAGMVMGVSLIGCYKLCCRTGKYLKPPSGDGEIRYKVKDDVIFVSVKNPRFKKEDPEALVATLFGRPGSVNGTIPFDQIGYVDPYATQPKSLYNRNAPGLQDQLQKNFATNNPGKTTLDKKSPGFVQLPNGKKSVNNQRVVTLPNEYVPIDIAASPFGSFSGNRSSFSQAQNPFNRPSPLHFSSGENERIFRSRHVNSMTPNFAKIDLNQGELADTYDYEDTRRKQGEYEINGTYLEVPETYVGVEQDLGRQREPVPEFSEPNNPEGHYSEEPSQLYDSHNGNLPSYSHSDTYSNREESYNNNQPILKKF